MFALNGVRRFFPALIADRGIPRSSTTNPTMLCEFASATPAEAPPPYIRTHLDPGGHSPDLWSLAALAPDDEAVLTFSAVYADPSPAQLLFDYRDLGNHRYSSALVIDEVGGVRRFYDAHLYDDHSVTPLGDSVPQPGLQDVAPRPSPGLMTRLGAAYRSFRSPNA
jgi:hypothetical protein